MTKGWQTKTLDQISTNLDSRRVPITKGVRVGGEFPYYGASGIVDYVSDYIFDGDTLLISEDGANLIARSTPIAFPASGKYWVNNHAHIVKFESLTTQRFVELYLESIPLDDYITGAAQPKLNQKALNSIPIPVPPLVEQQRIVGLLDEAFSGLAMAKANAEKNAQNARALFESHLDSVFTQDDKGWIEKTVGELVTEGILLKPFDGNHGEIHPKRSDYTESGVPFIMARDLQDGLVDTEHCIFISRKLADLLRVGFAKDGDVLISHKGTIGRSAIVSTEDDYIMLTPQVTSYRVKDSGKLFNRFIRYYFMSPGFQREMIAGAADGSTRAYIGITKQLALRFRFPSLAEQKRIAAELDVLDPETQRLATLYERKLAVLDALKNSLLHQAFNGNL